MNFIHKSLLFLFFIGVLISCNSQEIKEINYTDLKHELRVNTIQLVDIRTIEEYQKGAIPSAKNIDFRKEDFALKMEAYNKQKPIYIYCYSGYRSEKASKLLLEKGFLKVYNYSGGYKDWFHKER